MTRGQRRRHLWFWLILGPLLVAGMVVALASRPIPLIQPLLDATLGG